MSQKKLSNSEKQQFKNRLKKFGFVSFVVISSILNILFVVSLCVGCANTKKADAYNYEGVVTTPVVQTYNASSGYRVNATNISNSLPSNYAIYLDYSSYNTGDNYLPYVWQFDILNSSPVSSSQVDYREYFLVPLYSFRGSNDYVLMFRIQYNNNISSLYPYLVSFEVRTTNLAYIGTPLYGYGINNKFTIQEPTLFDELKYYNSYFLYSTTDVKHSFTYENNYPTASALDSSQYSRFLNFLKDLWYYFSTDTWKGNIHLDSDSILNANNYTLQNLKYEGLIGNSKNLYHFYEVSQGQTIASHHFFPLYGSFYYKGSLYNSLVFNYQSVYIDDNSLFEIYTGDINGSNIENQKLLYKCNDPNLSNLYYLESVSLCNSPNLLDITNLYNNDYLLSLFHVCSSEFSWLSMDEHKIFVNLMSSVQGLGNNQPWSFGGVGRDIDLVFGYLYDDGLNNNYSFIQYITNSYVVPVIVDPDNYSTEDLFAQTYSWINFIILSFIPLMSVSILPGVTLGVFIIMPIVLGLVLIIVRLFKR